MKHSRPTFARLRWWLLLLAWTTQGGDWPTYQHDPQRSGRSPEDLPAARLEPQWSWRSPLPPQTAWHGPARWDAYANLRGLKAMRQYDPVFHPVIAGASLCFGSSVDDTVYCLDTRTGRERWTFTADGPVRLAPTFWQGKLYFGADDGYAYCLDAASGRLVWKFNPAPPDSLVLHNGRFISFLPCRTGVLVDQGIAYFAQSLLPWKSSFLCAVDALTGQPTGPGRFVRTCESTTFEGALVASATKLISPQGRVPPLLFDRAQGAPLGSLTNGGGCFVLVTDDDRVLHGPGNKTGWIQESAARDRAKLATFEGALAMVVDGTLAYLTTETALLAVDRRTRQERWRQPHPGAHGLILSGQSLYVGGTDTITAWEASTGKPTWQTPAAGRVYGLAVADGALFASTDLGVIHCFRPTAAQPAPPPPVTSVANSNSLPAAAPAPPTLALAAGPVVEFLGRDQARVSWRTRQPSPTRLTWIAHGPKAQVIQDDPPKTQHEAIVTGLRHHRVYSYRIHAVVEGRELSTEAFECDTFFNYNPPAVPESPHPFAELPDAANQARTATAILERAGLTHGIGLVLGAEHGPLAYELARRSALRLIVVDTEAEAIARLRQRYRTTGVYGARLTALAVPHLSQLPFPRLGANLIISGAPADTQTAGAGLTNVASYLRPEGGLWWQRLTTASGHSVAPEVIGQWSNQLARLPGFQCQADPQWLVVKRGPLPGTGEWTHQYGSAANAAYAGETLNGATRTEDLEVQWLGRPGPRAQADRNGRKPAPLSAQGRLFYQGLQRLITLDAYNGTILWSRELPSLGRFNMPRDCGNWCVAGDRLYTVLGDQCWQWQAQTGAVRQRYPVPPGPRTDGAYDWGFVAAQPGLLLGSSVQRGAAYTDFWGGAGWYDATSGAGTEKICSDTLFALQPDTGHPIWRYARGLVLNSTLTLVGQRLYFVEARHPRVLEAATHRVGLRELWEQCHLVALELSTGQLVWERPIQPAPGEVAIYLAGQPGALVLVTSGQKAYHVYCHSDQDGQLRWQQTFPWPKDNHGGHMARPALVGDAVYVRPRVMALANGAFRPETMPEGGCGTYAFSSQTAIFRNANVTLWNVGDGQHSSWNRLRPDCWISTIPAAGMILSPEGGGGCSCGSWLETSIAFLPKSVR